MITLPDNKKSQLHRGAHYYFQSETDSDVIIISIIDDGQPFQKLQLMPNQIDAYLALATLEERRQYLYKLNPFGVRTKKAGVPAEVLEKDLDAIFLSFNEVMILAGIYVYTEMEQMESIERL